MRSRILRRYSFSFLTCGVLACSAPAPEGVSFSEQDLSNADGSLSATLTLQSQWGSGYCANVAITNSGNQTSSSWTVVVALNGSTFSNGWNAQLTPASGQLTGSNLSYNGALAPKASTSWGFCANGTSAPALISVAGAGAGGGGAGGSAGASGGAASGGASANGGASAGSGGAKGGTGGASGGAGGSAAGAAGSSGTGGSAGSGGTGGTAGGGSGGGAGTCTPGTAPANAASVNVCSVKQTMDGFGAADVWAGSLSAAQNTLFWDPVNGIGLSLLRVGIDGNGTALGSGAYADAIAANKFGVKVWGAPWSPPAADKSNNDVNNGGTLNTSAYSSWANVLASFAATFKSKTGFALYGISAQNEPDFSASYASCLYSKSQMVAFVKVLGPLLAAQNVNLIAAEPDSWSNLWSGDSYGTAILADPAASSAVNIIATHDYGHKSDSVTTRPAPPAGTKQHIWETEMSDETAPDVDIAHGIQVATWVYAGITTGGASAWHYWWLNNINTDGEGLLQKAGTTGDIRAPAKRLYTLGNFSKFVRPGYVRVDVSGSAPSGVLLSAFKNPNDGTVVVVAINPSTSAVNLPIFLSGSHATQATPWVTSASLNLAQQSPLAVTSSSFSATLSAQSVTTFVSK
jgi:glucuronoarabinoxylan endo-1,4-beta-xylanase